MKRAARSISNVSEEAGKANAKSGALSTGFGKLQSGFSRAAGGFTAAATAVGGFTVGLGSAVGVVGAFGIKTAGATEQAKVGFTTMLGSAQDAQKFMDQLK